MKKAYLLFSFVLLSFFAFSQKLDSTALILIDIQDFYFPGGKVELVTPEKAGEQAKVMLEYFRKNDGLVVHVRHNFQPGGDIHKLVKPIDGEKIVSKDEVNAFLNTDLNQYLKNNNIKNVVLVGMQTHMCLEGGTRAAYDLGYKCTVIGDACATRDLKIADETVAAKNVHLTTLATLKSYAKVVSLNEYLKQE
jgi:nicotinamidase-related amidase